MNLLRALVDMLAAGCWLRGHDPLREVGADELFLRCQRCRLRTRGVRIERARLVFTASEPRRAVVQPFIPRRRARGLPPDWWGRS